MKTVSQQVTAAYHKHATDWVLPNGRRLPIVDYREVLEIARQADKEIAELKMQIELIKAGV